VFLVRVSDAQTAEELLNDGKNTENVTTFGMGYDLKMYSPLKQINKSNVSAWFDLELQPGERHGRAFAADESTTVMYVVKRQLDLRHRTRDRSRIWRTPVQYERRAACRNAGANLKGPRRSTTASSSARRWMRMWWRST